jgi:hypothetical protein
MQNTEVFCSEKEIESPRLGKQFITKPIIHRALIDKT